MNDVLKKRIVCFSANLLATASVLISSGCLFGKIKNYSSFSLNNIDFLAAKSVFGSEISVPKFSSWFSKSKNKSNIYFEAGNNTNKPEKPLHEKKSPEIQTSDMDLPAVNDDKDDDEVHSENEKKYKLIKILWNNTN